jgi:subtilisin family serine protease
VPEEVRTMDRYKFVSYVSFPVVLAVGLFLFVGNAGNGPSFTPQGQLLQQEAKIRKIVVFKAGTSDDTMQGIVEGAGAKVIKKLGIVNAVVVHLPEQASDKAREAILAHAPVVSRIDDDLIVQALPKPPSPPGQDKKPKPDPDPEPTSETLPRGVDRIDADLAWTDSTGQGIKVAILDTGIDTGHPDLNVKGGINIINERKSYKDDNGHCTHVAGIVAALDNEIGVIGVAPNADLYAVKVLDRSGSGWLSDIIDGFDWCTQNDIKVINMSFGSTVGNLLFEAAVKAVNLFGIIQVAAAGNEGGAVNYPAKYPEVIAVSAVDSGDSFAYWSNFGPEVDLAAPGVAINSTYKGGSYKVASGTSMSAPHVAGAVALKLQQNPSLGPAGVLAKLKSSAENLWLDPEKQGSGLVDAETLVNTP